MLTIYGFKTLAKRYREAGKEEVSNHAIDYNYLHFLKGIKTPLIERMEHYFGSDLNLVNTHHHIADDVDLRSQGIPKHNFKNFDADEVLPYKKNLVTKSQTHSLAYALGKKYFIGDCHHHGQTLFYAKSCNFICCCCRYTEHTIDIKNTVKGLVKGSQQAAKKYTVKENKCEQAYS